MSYQTALQPECVRSQGAIALLINPKEKDLGDFSVRRVLPAPAQRLVGPFIFFDHMGPAEFPPGQGIQVRPHPHIGIATITYLFEGAIMHRDSLGYEQLIESGAVNLMTAGKGIVHSERAGPDLDSHARLHGIQSWIALPDGKEEIDPDFVHTPAGDLPEIVGDGTTTRVIMGEAFGQQSPVTAHSPTLYLDCQLQAGSQIELPEGFDELGAYVVSGEIDIEDRRVGAGVMAVACPGKAITLNAIADSRVMVIGGAGLGPRHIWWNFVSSSAERIEQAKREWTTGGFDRVPGDAEFIPLPERIRE